MFEVRQFLRGLVDSSLKPSKIPNELKALVYRHRYVPRNKADDVLQELFIDLLSRRGQSGCPLKLATLPAKELRKTLVCRVSQVVQALCPRFTLKKLLRLKTTRALKKPLPEAPASLPLTLISKGHVKVALVGQAVAFALNHGVSKEVKSLSNFLYDHYQFEHHLFECEVASYEMPEEVIPFAEPEFDLFAVANKLTQKLEPESLKLFLKYREGATLAELATPGAKVTTIHNRLKKISAVVKEFFSSKGIAAAEADTVFEALSVKMFKLAA